MCHTDLAARYLDLENDAYHLGSKEYEKALAALEKERVRLEKDREDLKKTFTLRVQSIQSQHDEAVARSEATEDEHAVKLQQAVEKVRL